MMETSYNFAAVLANLQRNVLNEALYNALADPDAKGAECVLAALEGPCEHEQPPMVDDLADEVLPYIKARAIVANGFLGNRARATVDIGQIFKQLNTLQVASNNLHSDSERTLIFANFVLRKLFDDLEKGAK